MEIRKRDIIPLCTFLHRLFFSHNFIILFFFITSATSAQDIRFKNLSVTDGLSHNTVTAFCQDKFGFMWIGTVDGLNKFDGNRFTIYRNDPADPSSLSDNSILSIYEDREGILWIGTERGGLNRFDPRTEIFSGFIHNPDNNNSISSNSVTSILSDKAGNLWISTRKGLNKLSASEKRKKYPAFVNYYSNEKDKNSITNNVIYSLFLDSKGSLWLSLSDGFGVDKLDFTDNSFTNFRKTSFRSDPKNPNSLSGDWVLYTFEDSKGRIWIGSWNAGLNRYDPVTKKFVNFKNDPDNRESLGSNYIEMITEDNSGSIWVATYDGGLNRFFESNDGKKEHFVNYKFDNSNSFSLPDNRALILYKDRSGLIWIGTNGHGISRFTPHNQFNDIILKSENKQVEYRPSAIIKTFDGSLWIGTYEGVLFRLSGTRQIKNRITFDYKGKPTRTYPVITSFCEDEEKTLWVATSRGGLYYLPKKNYSSSNPKFIPVGPIKTNPPLQYPLGCLLVKETTDLDLVIGTYNHKGTFLISREDKRNKRFDNLKQIPMPFTWSFANQDQYIWLGSLYNGISQIDTKTLAAKVHFTILPQNQFDKKSVPNSDIYTITKTSDNSIWFGTLKSLTQIKPGSDTLTHFGYKDGLANETVYGILEDDYGNLWISTYNGLSKFDSRTKLFTNFYREDGLLSNEFNQFSYYKDNEGLLYFGNIKGITIVNPKTSKGEISFPEVKITGVHISNLMQENKTLIKEGIIKESFNFTNEMVLPYNKNAFSIEFSALEYNSPQRIKYMYKLEGFNEDWVTVRPLSHFINFMNLDPKTYTLKIRSTNKEGIWNPGITEFNITINPPFYGTLWFKFLAVILAGSIVVFAHQYRIKASLKRQETLQKLVDEQTIELKERNADLESFSYSVSHDLRTPLRSIYSFSQIINEDFGDQLPAEAKSYFNKITNAAYNMTNLIDGILKLAHIARSDMNKKRINISKIAEDIIVEIKRLYPDKIINTNINPHIYADGDKTLITTVLENLISNAVKFSSNREEINIEIGKTRAFDRTKTAAAEVMYIKDNGIGFDMKYSEKLFQVFQRLHSSLEFSGTGIGLANVKKIINRHGGTVWAESEPEKGATFFFTL